MKTTENIWQVNKARITAAALAIGLFLATWMLAGCRGETSPSAPPSTATPETQTSPQSTLPGAALGAQEAAGPFLVTLSTDPASPMAGETQFIAKVIRQEQPVTDADVKVDISMPTMNMDSPEVTLTHTGNGEYKGKAALDMGGDYAVKVNIRSGSETGTADFKFLASQ